MASVDQIQGLSGTLAIKPPCRVATTAAITLSGEQTIDGVAVVADDRVLVKDQGTASENGIWVADTSAWSRALDFDGSNDVVDGTLVYVANGTVNDDLVFRCTGTNPITPGTTSITFTSSVTFTTMSAFFTTLQDDADAAAVMTTLGLTANGQSLVTAANYAAMRTLLSLVVGTNVQAYDADLTTLGAGGAAARTFLGLAIGTDVQAYSANANRIVQVVEATPIVTVVTCNSAIAVDDSIPQNTEGVEVITVTITPTSATNRLRIEFDCSGVGGAAATTAVAALFQDSTAGALAVATAEVAGTAVQNSPSIVHEMAAGTTSATTFKIRVGAATTVYVNGDGTAGARRFGGIASARLRVTETKL